MNKTLPSIIKSVAWAYVFIFVDINLGRISILPQWAGYWMIAGAATDLAKWAPETLLIKNNAKMLAAYHGLLWLLTIVNVGLPDVASNLAAIVVSMLAVYTHFQLITNIAAIVEGQGNAGISRVGKRRYQPQLVPTADGQCASYHSNHAVPANTGE